MQSAMQNTVNGLTVRLTLPRPVRITVARWCIQCDRRAEPFYAVRGLTAFSLACPCCGSMDLVLASELVTPA